MCGWVIFVNGQQGVYAKISIMDVSPETTEALSCHAANVRRNIIKMLTKAGSGHAAGALGLVEIMTCLYFGVLRYNRDRPDDPTRDLLVLSNGHVCPVLYATMAEAGLIPVSELMTLRQFGSRLQGHPERTKLSWLETTSGPLGEGMSQAAGMAYDLKYLSSPNNRQVYCVVGDGELDEGQNWEAAMMAGKYKLDNLTIIVDRNMIQLSGGTEDIMPMDNLASAFSVAGWNVVPLSNGDANCIESVMNVLKNIHTPGWTNGHPEAPAAILAYTTPGKGVDFMENDFHWHGKVPTEAQAARALAEIDQEASVCRA